MSLPVYSKTATRGGSIGSIGARFADNNDSFNQQVLYDTTPLPDSIPKVKEIGASSAPLLSASFFIGARCKDYNDDYMQCKTENPGKGEFECLKEGRRVTRCARSVYVLPGFSGLTGGNCSGVERGKLMGERCADMW